MFICDKCKQSSKNHHRVVAETRVKVYEGVYPSKKRRSKSLPGEYAKGVEIAKELNLCDACFEEFNNERRV